MGLDVESIPRRLATWERRVSDQLEVRHKAIVHGSITQNAKPITQTISDLYLLGGVLPEHLSLTRPLS